MPTGETDANGWPTYRFQYASWLSSGGLPSHARNLYVRVNYSDGSAEEAHAKGWPVSANGKKLSPEAVLASGHGAGVGKVEALTAGVADSQAKEDAKREAIRERVSARRPEKLAGAA